jgi:type IV secretory pathway VirB3-like protein
MWMEGVLVVLVLVVLVVLVLLLLLVVVLLLLLLLLQLVRQEMVGEELYRQSSNVMKRRSSSFDRSAARFTTART